MLRLQVAKRLGPFTLEAEMAVADRTVMVVVGESGSGKSTLLRLLAGLLQPDRGRIEVDGETWFEGGAGRPRAASERRVGYVAQDYALFPHLSAAGNVAFGLQAQGMPARDAGPLVAAALEGLGIGALANRRPAELSGGQQQRVAIARALVLGPRLLLLDEPLSALDAQARRAIRGELRRLLAGLPCTTLYVTHSPAEALALGDGITVLEGGRVSQHGTREDLMRRPRSPYVAEFLGVNLFRGSLATAADAAGVRIALPHGELLLGQDGAGDDLAVVVHPREITISIGRPEGTARNVFAGPIEEMVPEPPDGELVRVSIGTTPALIAEVTSEAVRQLGLAPGLHVHATFKATGVHVVQ